MSAAQTIEEIRRLSPNEREEVVESILDEFLDADDSLSPEQIAELDRRAEDALSHPERGRPAEEVFRELEAKYRTKR